jgi:hypothetical protein
VQVDGQAELSCQKDIAASELVQKEARAGYCVVYSYMSSYAFKFGPAP